MIGAIQKEDSCNKEAVKLGSVKLEVLLLLNGII
jgi:hypothetical protein